MSKKSQARIKTDGEIREAEMLIISGMVFQLLAMLFIAPTTANSAIIVLTSRRIQRLLKEAFCRDFARESVTKKEEENQWLEELGCKRERDRAVLR